MTTPIPVPKPEENHYIGVFTDSRIQASIDRVISKLDDGQSGLVVHLDSKGEASASVVQRFGSHVSVELAAVLDVKDGFKFDKEKLAYQAEVVVKW